MLDIRPLTVRDAEMFAEKAPQLYLEYFKYLWQDEGRSYVARAFALEVIKHGMESGAALYFGAFSGGEMVGFLKLHPAPSPPRFGERKAFEIEKIYLARKVQGQGIGKRLMELACSIAREMGREIVWLDVVAGNTGAIGFYENLGFVKCGTETIDFPCVKPEFRRLIVMKKELQQ